MSLINVIKTYIIQSKTECKPNIYRLWTLNTQWNEMAESSDLCLCEGRAKAFSMHFDRQLAKYNFKKICTWISGTYILRLTINLQSIHSDSINIHIKSPGWLTMIEKRAVTMFLSEEHIIFIEIFDFCTFISKRNETNGFWLIFLTIL